MEYSNKTSQIVQYILEVRNRGAFFSPDEYSLVDKWIRIEPDPDRVLLIISSVFEKYAVDNGPLRSRSFNLKFFDRAICKLLLQNQLART